MEADMLQAIIHIMMKSQHNSVLHAFSVQCYKIFFQNLQVCD